MISRHIYFIVWFWLGILTCSHAQLVRQLLLREEWFTLPQEELRLLLVAGYNDPELRQEIMRRVSQKRASQDRLMLVRTKSGQRTKTEQVDEFPYPTDFDPPQVSMIVSILDTNAIEAVLKQKLTPPALIPLRLPQRAGHALNGGIGLRTTITGTTFQYRNLGDILEIDPIIYEDGLTLDITFASERVVFMGDVSYLGVTQPQFQTQRINTSLRAISGVPILAGTCSKAANTGRAGAVDDGNATVCFITGVVTTIPPTPFHTTTIEPGNHEFTQPNNTAAVDPFAAAPPGESQESPPPIAQPQAPSLLLQVELFSLTTNDASALIDEHLADASARQRLIAMLPGHTAKLERLLALRTASGHRSKLDQVAETAFATDFDPPQLPQKLTIADPRITEILRQGGARGRETAHRPPLAAPNAGFGWITGLSPTTYQVRDIGDSLEVDPVLGEDGSTVDMTIALETLRVVGEITFNEAIQPIFETQKLNTSITTSIGLPCLLGTLSKPLKTGAPGSNETDRVWLAFITPTLD